jgi:CMP-N,N'-diacetyllegionaminic acid synthase
MRNLWAIIPARSGSKGFPGKNISTIMGVPLITHSINFAKKLKFVNKIILSTDSDEYATIGRQSGAEVPFLRSSEASQDLSMEEDILEDIRLNCLQHNINIPEDILWLRPTHPFRDIAVYNEAYFKYITGQFSSVCIVTMEDPRIFFNRNEFLQSELTNFNNRSMVRRQDCENSYRIFGGEFFPFPLHYDKQFLGKSVGFKITNKLCKFDIDYPEDIEYIEYLLRTSSGFKRMRPYLHHE